MYIVYIFFPLITLFKALQSAILLLSLFKQRGKSKGTGDIVVYVQDSDILVIELELQLHCPVQLRNNTLGKSSDFLFPSSNRLNRIFYNRYLWC